VVFWDVYEPEKTIVIELAHERYKKLIVEVEDTKQEIQKINGSIGGSRF